MHCLWQDGAIRTLEAITMMPEERVEEENTKSNDQRGQSSLAYQYYYDDRRRLYPKILPDFAGVDDYETNEGFCVEGFGNAACPVDTSSAAVVRHTHPLYTCMILLISCLLFIIYA